MRNGASYITMMNAEIGILQEVDEIIQNYQKIAKAICNVAKRR